MTSKVTQLMCVCVYVIKPKKCRKKAPKAKHRFGAASVKHSEIITSDFNQGRTSLHFFFSFLLTLPRLYQQVSHVTKIKISYRLESGKI